MKNGRRHIHHGKAALAALLVGMLLLLNAMAASPALHKFLHKDAAKVGHECAVTMFAHGKVESASVDVPTLVAVISIEASPQIEFSIFSAAIENLPPGRAPPAVVSSQV